ncbi:SCO6745 family protein [Actinomadura napierensis]|uniref:SalK n=1 Tax=Actinomadura napierensis TaxID=267854 RepID=A0ABN3AG25_9ACTN
MNDSIARDLWTVLEPLHAVTYFSPECLEAHKAVGLKGFWMGYFGSRAAPLGAVPPGVVEAVFFGFHPDRVRRAVPDAWRFASPERILAVRGEAAARALRRIVPGIEETAAEAAPALRRVVEAADAAGRPLFAANRDLDIPDDPVEAFWQAATALREHRGDGHVAVLTSEGLDGLTANVLAAAVGAVTRDQMLLSRGWTEKQWDAAAAALAERGLVDGGAATEAGRTLKTRIEGRTDRLAAPPYRVLDDPKALYDRLVPAAGAVADAGEMPFPNPIGLPRVGRDG